MVSYQPQQSWQDPRGGEIQRVIIDNGIIAMEVLSLGGIIRSLSTPDKQGQRDNIVLGCDSVDDYLTQQAYLGAIAGRYANRIANGQFNLNNTDYRLNVNQASNCLHGGTEGFHRQQWQMHPIENGVRLTLTSPDGDMGFPGECQVQLDYQLEGNTLVVEMHARVDKTCPISLTQHSYFNLAGKQSRVNHHHLIQVDAEQYLSMNDVGVPTGIQATAGSDLDLLQTTPMAVQQQRSGLAATQGFDHCYVLKQTQGLVRFGCLSEPQTGRTMTVYTNQPGVQLYGANFLAGNIGVEQQHYQQHQAVCIEPQMLPDSPNQPHLPGKVFIEPNETYHHLSHYQFGLIDQ